MLTGHRSHQVGLDADIWMLPPQSLNLTRQQRENISSISTRRSNGAYVNSSWTRAHHEIIKAAAQDPRTARIFVFPGAKVQMCNDEKGNRAYLRKIRPWFGHHYHFHVRLSCPAGSSGCKDQARPAPGDGCGADLARWFAPPKKPKGKSKPRKPKPPLTLASLPNYCVTVLKRGTVPLPAFPPKQPPLPRGKPS